MASLPRRNTWSELVLALDLYILRKPRLPDGTDPEVIALSDMLRQAARQRGEDIPNRYRSPNSVAMKLLNFSSLDPDYGGKGLDGTGGLDRAIWEEFSGRREAVHALAADVRERVPSPAPPDVP